MSTALPTSERDSAEINAAIDEIFGERAAVVSQYADLLCTDGIERGLLGPREADRVWRRHILNSAVLATLIPAGVRVVDLGSGAGLPGIPLAIARPDLDVVLLEPMQRRAQFLHDCLRVLPLPNVTVLQARAEQGLTPLADFVVARAIAPLDKLMRLSYELLADNGVLLALKGATAAEELALVQRTTTVDGELVRIPAPGQAATVIRLIRPQRSQRPGRVAGSRRAARGSR